MANTSVLKRADTSRRAGLVSVEGRPFPLRCARLDARAEGGVAFTTFTQTYDNPYKEPLEVLYTLPLPAGGAVTGYSIRLGERIIRGEVRRREEAREEYRKALLEGRTAALLEQDRADTFTQKLGCLPPGQSAEVQIEVLQLLDFLPTETGEPARWEYRFPTVAGIRYEGAEGRVPDADRLDVDRAGGSGTPVRLEAALTVADGSVALIQPHAPGREIDLEDQEGGVVVRLRERVRLDRDLVIRWSAASAGVGVRLVEGRGLPCDGGRYALITLTPPTAVSRGCARDLTVLIDASGSMEGIPISRAKLVAEGLLRSLDSGDRFELLAFASQVKGLTRKPTEASEKGIGQALAALNGLQAGGCTEMTKAIIEALKPLRPESQRQVILLSDGYIGFESEVIGETLRRLAPGARLHTVGIGSAPNRALTRGLARAGRGVEILAGDDDDARAASRRLLRATVRPVLTDIELSGSALVKAAPSRPKDVLEGQPILLLTEINPGGGRLVIRARQAGEPEMWVHQIEIPPAGAERGALAGTPLPLGALFAREAIEDVELEVAAGAGSANKEVLDAEIESLGMRHGIASRKTSLVAISEDPTVDPRDPRRRERLAVEIPAEVSAEGAGLASSAVMLRLGRPSMMEASAELFLAEPRITGAVDRFRELAALAKGSFVKRERATGAPIRVLKIRGARILRLEQRLFVFEFEVPEDGFLVPLDGTSVRVRFEDGLEAAAQVVAVESSRPGPHEPGLTVRVGLKLENPYDWNHSKANLTWAGRLVLPEGGSETVEINLDIQISQA